MKLALCLFKYFPYGGLQRNFLTVAEELASRGHELHIYTGSWEGAHPPSMSIHILKVKGLSNHRKNQLFYQQLQTAIKTDPVDLVIGFNKMPGLDIYYCADTCFATKAYEDKGFWYRQLPRSRWSLAYERAVFAKSAKTEVLLLSAHEGKAFEKYYGTEPARLHLVPPGINRSRVRTEASIGIGRDMRETLGFTPEQKVIAFVGSDYKRKGLDRLLMAVAALPAADSENVKVLVIGRDKHQAKFEKMAQQLGVRGKLLFVGQRDDIPALLFASNYLAHPAYVENTGNVLLEAVVAGLPVLCTAACGYAFYIEENELGYVVPAPFDQQQMNQQLAQLLNSTIDWRERCGQFARLEDVYSRPQRIAERVEAIAADVSTNAGAV